MDFINREAECSSSDSSDNYSSNDEDNDDLASFITDDNGLRSFYRDEHIFENQVRPIEDCDDPQPYLYSGNLMDADIHSFSDDKFRAEKF